MAHADGSERGTLMRALDLRYHRTMMRLFFRLFLWLSISVLSLQGGAAMAHGEAEGHAHHQVAAQDGAHHCCESDAKAPAAAHAKCPACAGCCAGSAAPPARLPDFPMPSPASSPHAGVDAAMTSFVPATLERPPRPLFV
jgi:hypothetical protein